MQLLRTVSVMEGDEGVEAANAERRRSSRRHCATSAAVAEGGGSGTRIRSREEGSNGTHATGKRSPCGTSE
jgi:hypothetical protein